MRFGYEIRGSGRLGTLLSAVTRFGLDSRDLILGGSGDSSLKCNEPSNDILQSYFYGELSHVESSGHRQRCLVT
jgi:hypothetical protein